MKRAITLILTGLALAGCSGVDAAPDGVAAEDTVAPLPDPTPPTEAVVTTVPASTTTTQPPPTTTLPPTTLPPVTVPPTTAGPNLVGATNFINKYINTLSPDLVGGACNVIRTQPDTAQQVMRDSFDFPAVHEQAATYGLSGDVFIDMMVIAYGNRLVTECS